MEVKPPTAKSEMPLSTRSSTIFGSATDSVLKTSPAHSATTTNRAKITAAAVADNATSGDALRAALCRASVSGMSRR